MRFPLKINQLALQPIADRIQPLIVALAVCKIEESRFNRSLFPRFAPSSPFPRRSPPPLTREILAGRRNSQNCEIADGSLLKAVRARYVAAAGSRTRDHAAETRGSGPLGHATHLPLNHAPTSIHALPQSLPFRVFSAFVRGLGEERRERVDGLVLGGREVPVVRGS